jgi:hypothetical protein
MRSTVAALERGDVQGLMTLTSREEIKRVGLTSDKVKALLEEGVWKNGLPRLARYESEGQTPRDPWSWKVWWVGNPNDTGPANVMVVDSLDEGLALC